MRRRLVLGPALALVAILSACTGKSGADAVASEMKSQFRESEGVTPDRVKCEEGKGKFVQGDRTTCAVTLGTVTVDYDVVFVSDDRFDASPKSTIIKKADLEKRLAEQQVAATRLELTVDCGPQPIYDAASLATAVCTAVTPTGSYPIRITVDGSTFSSTPAKPLVFKSEIEPFVASHLVTLGVGDPKVDCGPHPVLAVDPGTTLTCQSTDAGGTARTTTVTVDSAGKLSILETK